MRFLWLLLSLVVITGCGKSEEANTQDSKATEQILKPLDFIIDWQPEPTYLGIYYAVDSGEFEKIGYEVTVHTSWGAHQATAAIAAGKYMVGTASGGSTVLARSNDIPIKSLGVLYKDIPSVIYGIATKTMAKKPKDIEGMTIGIYPSSITNDEFAAFVKANHLDMDKITKIPFSGATDIPLLLSGEVDAILHYNEMSPAVVDVSKEIEAVAGQRAWRIHLKDHGITGYSLNIITSDDALAQHADTLQAITQAVYHGYTNACANSEDAVAKFIQRFPDKNRAHIAHGLDLVCAQLTDPIGQQTLSGWEATIKLFADLGLLNEPVDPQDLMAE